ncbi:hypothetical protein AAVH_17938 [Aphelenchoides avenae]|nr:hypothetical protein AAVH_17938 [Aphelenchus avenae]
MKRGGHGAVTPLITTTVPILFYFGMLLLKRNPGPLQCLLSIACTSITMFNPLTTVAFMRCYRDAILRALGLRKRVQNNSLQTRVTGLSVAITTNTVYPTTSTATTGSLTA